MYHTEYHRPRSLVEAAALLEQNSESKLLAGGHSLIPVLKQRLAQPSALIDLARIDVLRGIHQHDNVLAVAAMTPHAAVANSALVKSVLPGLAQVPAAIGDPLVQRWGTIGGSIANNDPNADYPAAVLGLDAVITTTARKIKAAEFFTGMFSTSLRPNEIIIAVSFPLHWRCAYRKFKQPASGFALVGVFVSRAPDAVRVAVTGAGANGVFRVESFEKALSRSFSPDAIADVRLPVDGLASDIHGSAEYRADLIRVLAQRAIAEIAGAR